MFHVAWKWKAIQGILAMSLSCASPAISNPVFLCPEYLFFTSLHLFNYSLFCLTLAGPLTIRNSTNSWIHSAITHSANVCPVSISYIRFLKGGIWLTHLTFLSSHDVDCYLGPGGIPGPVSCAEKG